VSDGPATRTTSATPATQPVSGGYGVDAFGRIHPFGGAPERLPGRVWDGVDIMRRVVCRRDGCGGYVMDAWGGVFPFGDVERLRCHGLWPGADVARDVALTPDDRWGYVLDTDGGLHRLGSAPWPEDTGCRGNVGKAVALALRSDGRSGYVLGSEGIVKGFGDALPSGVGPDPGAAPAVDLVLLGDDAGLVLRSDGSLVAFGGGRPPEVTLVKLMRGDRVVAFDALASGEGYVLTARGRLLPFGGAEPVARFPRGVQVVDVALAGRLPVAPAAPPSPAGVSPVSAVRA
jgi:hypothetical protein